ncbi:MAG: glycerol kinase [Candidatus Melainabacteria bacterium RIFCSPLOWO2_02_FULL_35_15]|nr:MAG: glycerol kinase [Candidatus Melainabacteria bacterium RIFCSPLOWO2_12_FULL_35_11]OGI14239.1 MAG: glycerol kinase [Candidatus Melainabacteria bacterium RIFCSPLOWO2_02_FULL_35_15]
MKYILSLDQGTTSSRALLIDQNGKVISKSQKEFKQIFPKPSWVEHDPLEIWNSQLETAQDAINKSNINAKDILGIGITNQRETIVAFDSESGKPVYNAIVWQCRRTADFCQKLKAKSQKLIKEKTGLEIDAYFSASKIRWILDNVVRQTVETCYGKSLRFGTIDSWLIYNLTGKKSFYTDPSNASRTMLYNIKENKYDKELLEIFKIEEWMLPKVIPSNGNFGLTDKKYFGAEIPVHAVLGDQQAALFGQCCFKEGDLKITYGTGGFLLINIGEKLKLSENFLTTIAWHCKSLINQTPTYAFEGSTFISGAIIQWLRDGLGIIKDSSECEKIALSLNSNEGVYLVPALVGLGAPHWDQSARGTILGLTRGSTKAHIVRAAVESMAYQIADLILPVKNELPKDIFIKADGGATKNNFLLQFQADLLGIPVTRSSQTEATALGVAYLAGLKLGFWKSFEDLQKTWHPDELFVPRINREKEYTLWKEALKRSLAWDIIK